jgi:hypothetical protein
LSFHGKKRRRRKRKVDIEDLNRPTLAAAMPLKEVERPVAEVAEVPVVEVDSAVAAREAAEKVAFDRSKMAVLPTLKERPPSREARQRRRDRKARDKRQSIVKTVVLPFSIVLAVILILGISWITYTRRETIMIAPDGRADGGKYVDDYEMVTEQNNAAWREKRARLLTEQAEKERTTTYGDSDVESEMKEREVQRRKRELLGTEEPFSDVFRKEKKYLPDPDD